MKNSFFISKTKKRPVGVLLVVLLLSPLAALAAYFATLVLLDSLRGDGLFLHLFLDESRASVSGQVANDAREALPVFYVVTLLIWIEIHFLARLDSLGGWLLAVTAGAVTGYVLAAFFIGLNFYAAFPAVVSGLLLSTLLAWALRPIRVSG